MGVHNFAKSSYIECFSTQTMDLEEFQCLDSSLQTKLVTAWQDSFPQHCLTFHHWFEFYKKKYLITPEKCLQLQQIRNTQNEANVTEDWDDATSTVLPPLSSSPKIHLTDLYLQENSMILTAPDNSKLIQLQQEPQNLRRLENAAIDISNVIYNA